VIAFAAALLLLWWAGCSRAPEPADDLVAQLQALGYLDFGAPAAQTGVLTADTSKMWPGPTLYTSRNLRRADIVAADGTPLHHWEGGDSGHWARATLLDDGDLLVVGKRPVERGWFRFLARYAWDNTLRWEKGLPLHHDVEARPDGGFTTLLEVDRVLPRFSLTWRTRDNYVARLDDQGQIVGKPKSLLEIVESRPDLVPLLGVRPTDRQDEHFLDVLHANSVEQMRRPELAERDPLYALDNVLVCIRHQNVVVLFSWTTGELLWAWGRDELSGPHDATVLDSGNILIFDNGLRRGWSRVVEVDPATNEIVWQYVAEPEPREFFTATRGANQRLPGGTTLITDSEASRVFEVTPEGEIVWDFVNPLVSADGARPTLVRAARLSPDVVERHAAGR